MDVLKRINRLRLERGWSLYRLAVEADIPQSTLTNMFNRETQPSIATLELICRAFGITMADFFSEDDGKKTENIDEQAFSEVYAALNEDAKRLVFDLMKELNRKA